MCDPDNNNLDCNSGDILICDSDSLCTVQCNDKCNGVTINARYAQSLFIKNCVNCDKLTVYCPQNGAYGTDHSCSLEIANNVNDVEIYAQESFYDFSLIQSPLNDKDYNMYSSTIHCGDLSLIEFQCRLNYLGNSCVSNDQQCQDYRIPTASPTPFPTSNTLSPSITLSPTITATPTIQSTLYIYADSNDLETTKEDIIVVVDDNNNKNTNQEANGFMQVDHNIKYLLLILGLCIIWGSFFCCFIILYCHKEKKELRKTITIISRPMSPTFNQFYQQKMNTINDHNGNDMEVLNIDMEEEDGCFSAAPQSSMYGNRDLFVSKLLLHCIYREASYSIKSNLQSEKFVNNEWKKY